MWFVFKFYGAIMMSTRSTKFRDSPAQLFALECIALHLPTSRIAVLSHFSYYMASSASGQDDPNRAMWLATRAGKMEPSCPLWTTRCILQEKFPRKPYNKSFMDQVGRILASFFFCEFMDGSTSSRSINRQKRTWPISSHHGLTLGQ